MTLRPHSTPADTNRKKALCRWGLCPHAPGIYRFPARMAERRGGWRRPAIPAAGSALRSHPCVAVSSAQVRPVYSAPQRPGRYNCKKACQTGYR